MWGKELPLVFSLLFCREVCSRCYWRPLTKQRSWSNCDFILTLPLCSNIALSFRKLCGSPKHVTLSVFFTVLLWGFLSDSILIFIFRIRQLLMLAILSFILNSKCFSFIHLFIVTILKSLFLFYVAGYNSHACHNWLNPFFPRVSEWVSSFLLPLFWQKLFLFLPFCIFAIM